MNLTAFAVLIKFKPLPFFKVGLNTIQLRLFELHCATNWNILQISLLVVFVQPSSL